MLEHGDLEMGHARALLSLADDLQVAAAKTVVSKGLSVRQTEALVRQLQQQQDKPEKIKTVANADIQRLEEELSQKLGSHVVVQHKTNGAGRMLISYNNLDELDGVLAHLRR